jgi:hypothetical protein
MIDGLWKLMRFGGGEVLPGDNVTAPGKRK